MKSLRFIWDETKARSNVAKHGINFALAEEVWDDPLHLIVPDQVVDGEERWHAIGQVGFVTLLVVVHAYPSYDDETLVRIIGARKATRHERRRYEEDAS